MSNTFGYNTAEWKKLSAQVIKRDGGVCYYCGTDDPTEVMTADHITPRSKGGTDTLDNLVCACRPCNSSKGNRTGYRIHWINRKWL